MDPNSLDSGSDHVLNIMSQEEESNIPSNSGLNTASEPIESDHDLNSDTPSIASTASTVVGSPTVTREPEINVLSNSESPDAKRGSKEPIINTGYPSNSSSDVDVGYRSISSGDKASSNSSVELRACERKASRSLLGSKKKYMDTCLPLYKAAITGDWETTAKYYLDRSPKLVRCAITPNGDTILHIAIRAEATKQSQIFVDNLVTRMEAQDLEIGNEHGEPAYMIAAIKGKVDMFKAILNKHNDILSKFPRNTLKALKMSAENGNHDMTLHLYNVLNNMTYPSFCEPKRWWRKFFFKCVQGDLFGIALKVLEGKGNKRVGAKYCFRSLDNLARKPDTINRTETDTYMIWRIADSILAFFHVKKNSPKMDNQALELVQRLLYKVQEKGMNSFCGLLFTAAEMDNTRFVIELIRMFPTIIHEKKEKKDDGKSIIHIAIIRRNKDIYNLLYETGSENSRIARWVDKDGNNILHLVAMTSNDKAQLQMVSGASLLMQRELLWYKEVEKIVPPQLRNAMNHNGKTPYEIFSENNKELVSKGLKWTRDCMVVATLIITVAFAVAFTVPGGYNQETGIPIFEHDTSFLVFVIADSFSLFTSSTSLLVFLSILTSPHGQRDFLYAMPGKLMIGLVTLFMSVAAMMVTFAASFFVIYQNTYKWLPILISVFAATPVIIFAALQYPFVMDMFRSMYDSRYLFNTGRRVLFNKNNRL